MPAFPLTYSEEDAPLVPPLAHQLDEAVPVHAVVSRSPEGPLLTEKVAAVAGPVVLLVTPQFLTNPNCLDQLADLLRSERPSFVLTHGLRLSNRPDRLQYISHWQDRYIDLRRGLDTENQDDEAAFQRYLERVRGISIGLPELFTLLDHCPNLALDDAAPDSTPLQRFLRGVPPISANDAEREAGAELGTEERIAAAWQLYEGGERDAAVAIMTTLTREDGEDTTVRYQHALMLAVAGSHPGRARGEVNELLDDDPYHPDGLYLSGELHVEQADYTAARNDWERLYDIAADYPQLAYRLGVLLAEHFDEDAPQAAILLREADQRGELPQRGRFQLARLLFHQLDRSEEAQEQLLRCLADDSAFAPAYYELATIAHANGQQQQANEHYRRAVRLEPVYATPANQAAFKVASPPSVQEAATVAAPVPEPLPPSPTPSGAARGTVLITGATSGIGRATARRLAAAGFRIILTGRREDRLRELTQELRSSNQQEATYLRLDVTDRAGVDRLSAQLPEDWRDIDVLINNAGKAKGFDPIHEGQLSHWDEMIDVNLRGLLYITRAVTPQMVRRGKGMVINIASTAGKEVYPNGNVYCATKHAVDALTHAMRLDLVKYGIRVGQICPAHVEETEFAVVRFDGDRERAKIYEDFQPLRSSDVAEAIAFMVTQPAHVNVLDMVIQGTQQASSTVVDRSGRGRFANSPTGKS